MLTPFLDDDAKRFLDTYRGNLKNTMRVADELESLEVRQQLAREDPRKAHILEGQIKDERDTMTQELAFSIGVAEAIRYAWERLNDARP